MNTKYTNFTKLERYIDALKGEYYQEYPEFTFEQIRRPIYLVAGWVDSDVNKTRSEKLKMLEIDIYRETLREREKMEEDGRELERSMLGALYFLIKIEESVRGDVTVNGKVPFPEDNKEKYLEFVSKMTERVVLDMCDTLEKKISHAGKVEYWKWVGQEPEESKLSDSPKSFVENVSSKKRSATAVDEPQPFTEKFKSKKVTLALD